MYKGAPRYWTGAMLHYTFSWRITRKQLKTYAKQPDQKYAARSSMRAMRVVAAASGTGVLWRKVSLGHGYVWSLVSFVVGLP